MIRPSRFLALRLFIAAHQGREGIIDALREIGETGGTYADGWKNSASEANPVPRGPFETLRE
jgi:hypothetical protein